MPEPVDCNEWIDFLTSRPGEPAPVRQDPRLLMEWAMDPVNTSERSYRFESD